MIMKGIDIAIMSEVKYYKLRRNVFSAIKKIKEIRYNCSVHRSAHIFRDT